MHSYSEDVRRFISVLDSKIQLCTEPMTPLGICTSVYGLKNMNDDNPEVRQLLATLTSKIAMISIEGKYNNLTGSYIIIFCIGDCYLYLCLFMFVC